jgi:hypothetical protein
LVKPYTQDGELRVFSEDVDSTELVWHRDRNDREVTVVEGSGWKIQYDNQMPQVIEVGKPFFIKAYEYHRLHKGSGTLKLKIKEMI